MNDQICLTCGNASLSPFLTGLTSSYSRNSKYTLMRCNRCLTLMTYPMPSPIYLEMLYKSSYAYEFHHLLRFEKRMRAKNLLKQSVRRNPGDLFVELGCSDGTLLKLLQQRGFEVSGCEIDSHSVEIANQRLQENCVKNLSIDEFLGNYHLGEAKVVIMSHVLEHLANPQDTLLRISREIKAGCELLIALPNYNSLGRRIFGKFWGYWQVPVHITHHNSTSILNLLQNNGFQITQVRMRNCDFLTVGSLVSNFLGLDREQIKPSLLAGKLIQVLSMAWTLIMNFGNEEMVILAKKLE